MLAQQTLPDPQYELLLCDSGSTDGTLELVEKLAIPNLRHLCLTENRGRSGARNALLNLGLFDENFTEYGHEDLELGYRLQKGGWPILYNSRAVNYHWHPVSFEERCDKMLLSGVATRRFYKKYLNNTILLRLGVNPATLGLHSLISAQPAWREKVRSKAMQTRWGRDLTLQYYYLCGYRDVKP